jgi:hypothetical protein
VWGGYFDAAATLIQAPFLYHYDGNVWAMTSAVATPPSRACPAMVFDARQGELRIFGGENSPTGTTHADAWAFNGTTWTQVTASGHQAAGAAMGFDPIRERSVIFGGRLTGGAMSAATYALGAVGPLVALSAGTAPPPRFLTSAAYDEGAGELVIFGGRTAAATSLGDTWTWDGMRWTLETPATSPSPRTGAALAYDQAGSRVVLFGGYPGSGETWIWNGVTWTLLPLAGGPASLSTTHSMVYDATREAVVLGHVEGTFALVGDAWVELDDVALDSGVRLAYQPGGVGLLQVGPATLRFDDDAWLDGGLDPELPSRNAPSVAYAAGRGELVVFGGYGAAGALADTWTSNGQRWQVALTATRPIARGMAATAYDPVRDEVVLTGGSNGGGGAYGDTWRLRWLGDLADEACAWHQDLDGDGLVACDDPDCWPACAPTCPPVLADAGTCDPTDPATLSGPHCGDGACATWEGPRLCPSDCATAPPMCGDAWCDDGETDVSCPADC